MFYPTFTRCGGPALGSQTDPYFANVIVLAHFDVAGGGGTITPDYSPLAHNIFPENTASLSSTQVKYGANSLKLVAASAESAFINNNADLELSGVDFTAECWFYANALATKIVLGRRDNVSGDGWQLITGADGSITVQCNGTAISSAASAYAANAWYHLAVSRQSGTGYLFLNGIQVGTGTLSFGTNTEPLWFGRRTTAASPLYFDGYIDDVRITKGVARYTANFSVPPAAFPNS